MLQGLAPIQKEIRDKAKARAVQKRQKSLQTPSKLLRIIVGDGLRAQIKTELPAFQTFGL